MNYWKARFDRINQAMMDNSEEWMREQVRKIYLVAYKDISETLKGTSDLALIEIYLNKILYKLGEDECKTLKQGLLNHAGMFQINAPEQIVESIWCSDGKSWSDRIWIDKIKLKNALKDGLTKVVIEGNSGADLVKAMQDQSKFYPSMTNDAFKSVVDQGFNTSFNNASRLIRTELTFVQNQCSVKRYEQMGIEKYEFVAEVDSKTSDICLELNGKIFNIKDAEVGKNLPPCHCFCRSCIVPFVETKDKEV